MEDLAISIVALAVILLIVAYLCKIVENHKNNDMTAVISTLLIISTACMGICAYQLFGLLKTIITCITWIVVAAGIIDRCNL